MRVRLFIDLYIGRNWNSASNAASCQTCGRNNYIGTTDIMLFHSYRFWCILLLTVFLKNVTGKTFIMKYYEHIPKRVDKSYITNFSFHML